MHISTLGAGSMAGSLARAWLAAGHDVTIAGRTPAKAAALAAEVGARTASLRNAAAAGDVLLLAVLAVDLAGVDATLDAADGALAGKTLVDCTNPVEVERFTLTTKGVPDASLAARVERRTAPTSSRRSTSPSTRSGATPRDTAAPRCSYRRRPTTQTRAP
jgi:predicted dinucleotide-binding enzyme